MTDADTSQRISAMELHAQRIASLEKLTGEHATMVGDLKLHRERMETRWGLVALIVGAVAASGLGSAVVTRDTTRDNAQRLTMLERAITEQASDARTSAAEGRGTHDAIVRLTATVDALRVRVEELTSELHQRDASRAR